MVALFLAVCLLVAMALYPYSGLAAYGWGGLLGVWLAVTVVLGVLAIPVIVVPWGLFALGHRWASARIVGWMWVAGLIGSALWLWLGSDPFVAGERIGSQDPFSVSIAAGSADVVREGLMYVRHRP